MLKTQQLQKGDRINWTPTNIRQHLKQDPFFTITNNIRLNPEGIQKLEQQNKAHTKNPPQHEDQVKEWICVLWVLSDLVSDSAETRKLNSVTALKLSKQINNAKYIKPSACRLVINAFEGIDQDELLKEILCTQSKPGKFKQNILLCAAALRIIYLNNGLYFEQATKFWFYSLLFNNNPAIISKKGQTFEEIMKDIRIQAMHGLIHTASKQKLLECVQKENQIFMPEEKKKVVNSMVEKLKFVGGLFKNVDTSFEIEDLILRGVFEADDYNGLKSIIM